MACRPEFQGLLLFFATGVCRLSKENQKTHSPNGEGGGENLVENNPNRRNQKRFCLMKRRKKVCAKTKLQHAINH